MDMEEEDQPVGKKSAREALGLESGAEDAGGEERPKLGEEAGGAEEDAGEVSLPAPGGSGAAPIRIVRDYQRPSRRAREATVAGVELQSCPITGQLVQAGDMTRHLKVLLLDPRWKEQKDRLLEKARKESAFAPLHDVDGNLAAFVAKRPDLFGAIDELEEKTNSSAENKKNAASSANANNHAAAQAPPSRPAAGAQPAGGPPTNIRHAAATVSAPPSSSSSSSSSSSASSSSAASSSSSSGPFKRAGGPLGSSAPSEKRPRMDEQRFMAMHEGPLTYSIAVAPGGGLPACDALPVPASVKLSVGQLIAAAADVLKDRQPAVNVNKQQLLLRDAAGAAPFLEPNRSLAFYNLGPNSSLELSVGKL
eukprot:GHVT01104053.1.p1 GENE.GHVT01104053.1~~GHVT01104053.1.p1  ORF type:complete len:427 (-),score=176.95 GHVT01104053.1:611-1705(-)